MSVIPQITKDLNKLSEFCSDGYAFVQMRFFIEELKGKIDSGKANNDDKQLYNIISDSIHRLNGLYTILTKESTDDNS